MRVWCACVFVLCVHACMYVCTCMCVWYTIMCVCGEGGGGGQYLHISVVCVLYMHVSEGYSLCVSEHSSDANADPANIIISIMYVCMHVYCICMYVCMHVCVSTLLYT